MRVLSFSTIAVLCGFCQRTRGLVAQQSQQQSADSDPLEARRIEIFQTLDGNADGIVTKEEYFAVLGDSEPYQDLFVRPCHSHLTPGAAAASRPPVALRAS